ncbi:MAG: sugar transferase [Clostridia bacterium]|nr:sugar transferase [Clostridia bacterium]
MRKLQFAVKRLFDIVAASLIIVILTVIPVLIVIPIVIRLTSKGSAVFKQERMGKGCKRFNIYKFRTMKNPPEGTYSVNGILYKPNGELLEPSSTRITKVGAFLRKTSLDELMQLFNILNGTMSFVGPRPTLPYQAESYSKEQLRRFEVRPGVTGLAQVSGRNDLTWTEKIRYDIEYIDHFSLWLDIKILFRTVGVVLKKDQIDFVKEDALTAKAKQDAQPKK